ncbi:MAG: DNA polymerase Y family protein [Pseudomonas sp.]|uniref:Y-family DNA polymerase n=1 Tax=Pseudomonas abieticivorans TaxID=2931382 RepID=UPI0020C092E8|nr:DNA polymerase Y family protein [Pseudomonas sp. PIA16]MDE1167358.1 DNA polymerase Y family protein [Pseudomonas sp.]
MLWACIVLPQLALDGVLRRRDTPQAPLALVTGPAQRRVLQAVNPAARALGLKPGQLLTAAHAMTRDFATEEYDAAQVEHWQQFLAAWAYRFSSQVSLHYPRVLLLEVGASLGLFGPWPVFEARLRAELTELGFSHRISLAPNPAAARMLANARDGLAIDSPHALGHALAPLAIERIGLPRDAATAFARMGLRTLGQVLALPRDTLARRFGAGVLAHLNTLTGLRPMPLEYYLPPDFFEQRIELNFDVESHQALLFPLRRLITDLATFLAGRDGGVQRFTLHLEHAEGEDTLVPVGLLGAERDPNLLFELARGRFEQLQVPRPVRCLRLMARDLPAFVPTHQELFDERPQQTQPWEQLRERLRARLGDEALTGLCAQGDHRPECAWGSTPERKAAPLAHHGLRPGWLLPQAQLLGDLFAHILAGPERIESGWWDGGDVRRDYYLIETPNGQRAWAYRSVGEDGLWLQGWFG